MGVKINLKDIIYEIEYLLIIAVGISFISKGIREYLSNYYVCLSFAIFHELAHILAATCLNKKLRKVFIGISGLTAYFKYEYKNKTRMYYVKDIIIFAAGPLANIVMVLLFKNIKFIYEINIFLAMINLLPIYPLDGFNILKSFLYSIYINSKNKVNKIIKNFSILILLIVSAILIILFFRYKNITSIIFMAYILIINIKKISK